MQFSCSKLSSPPFPSPVNIHWVPTLCQHWAGPWGYNNEHYFPSGYHNMLISTFVTMPEMPTSLLCVNPLPSFYYNIAQSSFLCEALSCLLLLPIQATPFPADFSHFWLQVAQFSFWCWVKELSHGVFSGCLLSSITTIWVALGKSLKASESQFHPLENGDDKKLSDLHINLWMLMAMEK